MDQYVTGAMIKRLREERNMTQAQLAEKLCISDKTVSKWETAHGYPDISLLAPLAEALGISVGELLAGNDIRNVNTACNMLRTKLYVCPICNNVLWGTGEAAISCHGISLPPLEAEPCDEAHMPSIETVEDEYYVTAAHEMTKQHYISFLAALYDDGVMLTKLYPEGNAEARFKQGCLRKLYLYCNRHGLFEMKPPRK